jgi:hypothetical protein
VVAANILLSSSGIYKDLRCVVNVVVIVIVVVGGGGGGGVTMELSCVVSK